MMLLRPEISAGGDFVPRHGRAIESACRGPDGKRALICAGRHDPIIPIENAGRLAARLKDSGGDVRLETLEASHGLVPEDVAIARQWLEN